MREAERVGMFYFGHRPHSHPPVLPPKTRKLKRGFRTYEKNSSCEDVCYARHYHHDCFQLRFYSRDSYYIWKFLPAAQPSRRNQDKKYIGRRRGLGGYVDGVYAVPKLGLPALAIAAFGGANKCNDIFVRSGNQ